MLKESRVKLQSFVLELHALVGLYAASRAKLIGENRFHADDLDIEDFAAWAEEHDLHETVRKQLASRKKKAA